MAAVARGIHLHVQHAAGDDAPFTAARDACILDRVLEVEQHAGHVPWVAGIHEHRSAVEEIAMTLEREVERGIEERMTGADESRERLPLRRDERLLERDPLVARQDRLAEPD